MNCYIRIHTYTHAHAERGEMYQEVIWKEKGTARQTESERRGRRREKEKQNKMKKKEI